MHTCVLLDFELIANLRIVGNLAVNNLAYCRKSDYYFFGDKEV